MLWESTACMQSFAILAVYLDTSTSVISDYIYICMYDYVYIIITLYWHIYGCVLVLNVFSMRNGVVVWGFEIKQCRQDYSCCCFPRPHYWLDIAPGVPSRIWQRHVVEDLGGSSVDSSPAEMNVWSLADWSNMFQTSCFFFLSLSDSLFWQKISEDSVNLHIYLSLVNHQWDFKSQSYRRCFNAPEAPRSWHPDILR